MNNYTKITEQDIFFYVFSKDELNTDKIKYIEENLSFFTDQISFCEEFNSDKTDDDELRSVISQKISEYSVKIVDLYPVKLNNPLPGNKLKYAAASAEADVFYPAETFIDKNSEYLTRITRNNNTVKLYIYQKGSNEDTPLNVIIYPAQKKFTIENPSEGFLLEGVTKIERIRIEQ